MAYASITKPGLHFNNKLYAGANKSVTGIGFQPDFVWIKERDAGYHALFDAVRGVTKLISSNANSVESTASDTLTAFGADGFTLGADSSNYVGGSSTDVASWNWKAGGGQGSSNTDGSINTTYTSANTTSGFSISKYTGTGSNATVGHGLGVAPKIVITKQLGQSRSWAVFHQSIGHNKAMFLDTTAAADSDTSYWNDTSPTTTTFSLGTRDEMNKNAGVYIAYCFAEKKGFSKIGRYVGTGANDGAFVYCGFKPAWILRKCSSGGTAENWVINDNRRPGFNQSQLALFPNNTNAEDTATHNAVDFLSNGFKVRTNDGRTNADAKTYLYMAFAENPLVANVGNSIPTTAE